MAGSNWSDLSIIPKKSHSWKMTTTTINQLSILFDFLQSPIDFLKN
jgi:hypothetical protein